MWRWQCIRDYSFQDVLVAREIHEKPIVQAVEWNVPGHEHCGVGIIADQFGHWRRHHGHPGWSKPDASPVAEFEYLFDANDTDMAGGLSQGWVGKNTLNNHGKAVAAAAWLQANYPTTSWMVIAHPERKGAGDPNYIGSGSKGYNIEHFRDLNNAAPDVCFGFESMPGHQKEGQRGGYGSSAIGGGTFGGCGAYAAKVGGLWDAMLGEGRHWWLFANSDFHNTVNDFWPGEYQKNYTYVAHKQNPQAIVDGLRSGNTFVVEGDLIDALNFTAEFGCGRATMGQTLPLKVKKGHCNRVKITIWFRSPELNNNNTPVAVDHIDLIAGDVTGFKTPGTADYTKATNESTKVIARFTADDWKVEKHGWCVIHYCMPVDHSMYFRLRGTNMPPNTPNETDADGNPLSDTLMGANTAEKAWADLWFYSNPIFVRVQN
jgi:hypothetical protein